MLRRPFESAQYAADLYRKALKEFGLQGSMGRRGNPYDNARPRALLKTLKCEHVYLNEYRNFAEVAERVPAFIDQVYNTRRCTRHLAIAPVQFEERYTR